MARGCIALVVEIPFMGDAVATDPAGRKPHPIVCGSKRVDKNPPSRGGVSLQSNPALHGLAKAKNASLTFSETVPSSPCSEATSGVAEPEKAQYSFTLPHKRHA